MSFRPKTFSEIIGQKHIIDALSISVQSAKIRGDSLGHTLFSGPPGLGKTTMAMALANELGVSIKVANGATFKSPKVIVPYLVSLEPNSILFVDEIHRLSLESEEFLYPVMEDFTLNIVAGGKGGEDKVVEVPIPSFTLVGATTETGSLAAPFRDRFKLKFTLELYDVETLYKLIHANCARLGLRMDADAIVTLAQVSRGTPRISNALLEWVRDFTLAHKIMKIGCDDVVNALAVRKIDANGLTEDDRRYLDVLQRADSPMGLKTLSFALNMNQETIENVIEPFLLRLGLVQRTTRGRIYKRSMV